jgi:hypothetical protein
MKNLKNKNETMKIGDKVKLTEEAKDRLYIDDDVEYVIIDIIKNIDVPYPIVLNTPKFGRDWVQFFNKKEIIKSEPPECIKKWK